MSARERCTESCATCFYWRQFFKKGNLGQTVEAVTRLLGSDPKIGRGDCVRHAPTAHGWHSTSGNEWCGDYEPRGTDEQQPPAPGADST